LKRTDYSTATKQKKAEVQQEIKYLTAELRRLKAEEAGIAKIIEKIKKLPANKKIKISFEIVG
jgi:hypothetical protein